MMKDCVSRRSLVAIVAALALALIVPSLALANDISSAGPWPGSGGNGSLALISGNQQVYRVPLAKGDWFIAYAWVPGTTTAGADIKMFDSSASVVASPSVGNSDSSGIMRYKAPADGLYYVSFGYTGQSTVTRGVFKTHTALTTSAPHAVVVPYHFGATLAAHLSDAFYTYLGQGPQIGFEPVTLSSSTDNVTWTPIYTHVTNASGDIAYAVAALSRKTYFRFDYAGAVYDTAAFSEARSLTVAVVPQVRVNQKFPASAKHKTTFTVSGTLEPKHVAGVLGKSLLVVQARKTGTSKVYEFPVRAYSSATGYTPVKASVKLPSAGTWVLHFYHAEDSANAMTSTKWVRVSVK